VVHVLDAAYRVVLEVEQAQLVLGLERRARRQTTPTTRHRVIISVTSGGSLTRQQ